MRMKVNSNKLISSDFSRNVLDGCRYDHDDIPLVYPDINFLPCQLQDMPCSSLVLIHLEFTIGLIESACTSLLITNPNLLLRKSFKTFSEIDLRIEYQIRKEGPPLLKVTNHLPIVCRNIDAELDT